MYSLKNLPWYPWGFLYQNKEDSHFSEDNWTPLLLVYSNSEHWFLLHTGSRARTQTFYYTKCLLLQSCPLWTVTLSKPVIPTIGFRPYDLAGPSPGPPGGPRDCYLALSPSLFPKAVSHSVFVQGYGLSPEAKVLFWLLVSSSIRLVCWLSILLPCLVENPGTGGGTHDSQALLAPAWSLVHGGFGWRLSACFLGPPGTCPYSASWLQ